ncbi:hypothetical protein MKQ70_22025 [Chitinophaga sedimenti]|uniref:hypothetical protein n=1 Tax=Chitinophaga sedimenti TaxID=2033606 RepID=UPI00200331EE|nr:hypothetical protein [Chitinophaga sedimenti]MCK7557532.1 hypothetical protein [Chitinophaga sedimenti]
MPGSTNKNPSFNNTTCHYEAVFTKNCSLPILPHISDGHRCYAGAFAAERAVAGADRVVLSVREDSLKFYGGVLTDDKDAPVAFATLKVRRSGYVAQSDEAGNFKLNGAKGDAVDVSFGKALLSTFVLGDEASLRFVISSRNPALQRTKPVRLLYGVAAQPHLTAASTQAVYTDDIARMNVTSLKNALVGQFAGLQTNQSSGQPGYDEVSFQCAAVRHWYWWMVWCATLLLSTWKKLSQ